jgi:hypothetical protein
VIQQQLELPGTGFTYLRSHGVLDQQHIGLYESLVNRLEAENDRRAVLDTARVMYRLYAALFANLPRPEDRRAAA